MRKTFFISMVVLVCAAFSIFAQDSTDEPILTANKKSGHFVLIHGSWHGGWTWYKQATVLVKKGYDVTILDLPGHGIDLRDPGTVTLQDYTDQITSFLDTVDEPVILVGHSMGGIAISSAAEARPDKVAKLVYIAAFLVENGKSLFEIASLDSGSLILPNLIVDPVNGIMTFNPDMLVPIFYDKCPDNDVFLATTLMRPDPLAPIMTPLTLTDENYGSIPRFYVTTLQDQAVSPELQEMMYTNLPCEEVFQINTDHSPFFSSDTKLREILIKIATKTK